MKISVVVPIYNVEKEIIRCLRSVVNQNYADIELVLVNDDTPDQSFELACEFIKLSRYTEKTKLASHLVNLGISEARNTGMKIATGDYIFFIDSDDELANDNVLSELANIANRYNNVEIIIGGFNRVNETGVFSCHNFKPDFYKDNRSVYYTYTTQGLSGLAWGKLILRSFLINNDLYFKSDIYHEDIYWSFNTYRIAKTVIVTDLITYNYYYRGTSITANLGKKNVTDLVTVSLLVYEKYQLLPTYYKQETSIVVENLRRQSLSYITEFLSEKKYSIDEIKRLKTIKIPFYETGKSSLLRLNMLLRFPSWYIFLYLKVKKALLKK